MYDYDDISVIYTDDTIKPFYLIEFIPTNDDDYPEELVKVYLDGKVEYLIKDVEKEESVQRAVKYVLKNKC